MGADPVIEVQPEVPRLLVGDPLRLGQVLINLVNNAVKFTAEGGLELRCMLLAVQDADGKAVLRFVVRDSGIGMTPQQKSKLFRAFNQANGSTTRQYGGTGLGLSISQQLVRLMGGNIEVQSEVDRGSAFQFDLPFALSDAVALSVQAATPSTATAARESAKNFFMDFFPCGSGHAITGGGLPRIADRITGAAWGRQGMPNRVAA